MRSGAAAASQDVTLPLGQIRAALVPASVDVAKRTVDLVWTTGARVKRYSFWDDEPWFEELSLDDDALDLSRLRSGAPLLAAHQSYGLDGVIGVVEDARLEGAGTDRRGVARVRFSTRGNVDPIVQDVTDGIIRNVSVGYITHELEEQERERGKPRVYVAKRWEPTEISLVAVGADPGAQTRAERDRATSYPCVITRRPVMGKNRRAAEDEAAQEDRAARAEDERPPGSDPPAEDPPPPPPPADDPPAGDDPEESRGRQAERDRVAGILSAVRSSGLEPAVAEKLAEDHIRKGTELVDAHKAIFRALAVQQPRVSRSVIEVGSDGLRRLHEGIIHHLWRRIAPGTYRGLFEKLDEKRQAELNTAADDWKGMSLMEMGRTYLNARGVSLRAMDRMKLAAAVLGMEPVPPAVREGPHSFLTTSDFPTLLAQVGRAQLTAGYTASPRTFPPWTRQGTLPDFRATNKVSLGLGPKFLKIDEHGEYTRGPLAAAPAQAMKLDKYGRILAFTREALINDDVGLFVRIPQLFGGSAAAMESDVVYGILTGNQPMADGFNLFSSQHGNLMTAGAINVANMGAARQAMMNQKTPDGQFLTVMPRFLIVGPAQEVYALQFLAPISIVGSTANVVPSAYQSLQLVVEPRITDLAWYLAADPNQIDTIEYDYLEGAAGGGPALETREGWDIDGQEYKAREEFAAAAIDFRGLVKNPGALPTGTLAAVPPPEGE